MASTLLSSAAVRRLALLLLAVELPLICCADEPVTIDAVASVWQARQEAITSGKLTWRINLTIYPGAIDHPRIGKQPKDTVHQACEGQSFAFEPEKFAYRYCPQDITNSGKADLHTIAADGPLAGAYNPQPELGYGQGIIYADPKFPEFSNYNLWPFLLTFRPLVAEGAEIPLAELELDPSPVVVDGRTLYALRWKGPLSRRTFLVDPAIDLSIVRFEEHHEKTRDPADPSEFLSAELDIRYGAKVSGVNIPASWKLTYYHADSRPRSVVEGSLSDVRLNAPFPASEFAIFPFPEGTLVNDLRDRTQSWQLADGTLRPTTAKTEATTTTKPEPSASPADAASTGWRRWMLLGFNGALLVVICFALIRRNRVGTPR